mmetsp:Transcript_19416/g.61778  ORF Transcript_19416/g.61778 Transcript_19416/m.61778 type:complete len:237 (-) Transcript_19416:1373-2083(-)
MSPPPSKEPGGSCRTAHCPPRSTRPAQTARPRRPAAALDGRPRRSARSAASRTSRRGSVLTQRRRWREMGSSQPSVRQATGGQRSVARRERQRMSGGLHSRSERQGLGWGGWWIGHPLKTPPRTRMMMMSASAVHDGASLLQRRQQRQWRYLHVLRPSSPIWRASDQQPQQASLPLASGKLRRPRPRPHPRHQQRLGRPSRGETSRARDQPACTGGREPPCRHGQHGRLPARSPPC